MPEGRTQIPEVPSRAHQRTSSTSFAILRAALFVRILNSMQNCTLGYLYQRTGTFRSTAISRFQPHFTFAFALV